MKRFFRTRRPRIGAVTLLALGLVLSTAPASGATESLRSDASSESEQLTEAIPGAAPASSDAAPPTEAQDAGRLDADGCTAYPFGNLCHYIRNDPSNGLLITSHSAEFSGGTCVENARLELTNNGALLAYSNQFGCNRFGSVAEAGLPSFYASGTVCANLYYNSALYAQQCHRVFQ